MNWRLALSLLALIIGIAGFWVQWHQAEPQKQLIPVEVITAARDGIPDRRIGGGTR